MLSYYLTIEGPSEADADLLAFFRRDILEPAKSLTGIVAVRAFQPDPGDVALFDDEGAPRLLVQMVVNSADGFSEAFAGGALAGLPNIPVAGCRCTHQLFELVEEPLPAARRLAYGDARLSFAVRYYANDRAETIAAFQRSYLDGHPAALAHFPGIRRIFCYLPVDWDDPSGIAASNSIIGNEVVFDSLEDLNTAIRSPALKIVGEHSRSMPAMAGSSTHFAMTLADEWIAPDSEQ